MKSSLRLASLAAMTVLMLSLLGLPALAAKPTKPGPSPSPTPSADFSLSVIDSADPVLPAHEITYVVTVANAGPSSTSVSVEASLSGAMQMSIAASQGSCSTSTIGNRCQLGTVLNGGVARVTIVGRATSLESVTLTASAWGNLPDPNGSNNRETELTGVTSGYGACGSAVHVYDSTATCTFTSAGGPITLTGIAGFQFQVFCSPGIYCPILNFHFPEIELSLQDQSGRILASCRGTGRCTASSLELVPAGTVLTCSAAVRGTYYNFTVAGPFACTG